MLAQVQTRQTESHIPEHLRTIAEAMLESSGLHGCKRRKSLSMSIVARLFHDDVHAMKRWLDDICGCLQESLLRYMSWDDMRKAWSRMTRECGESALKFDFSTQCYVPRNAKPRGALVKLRGDWMKLRENVLRLIDLRMIWLAENGYLGTVSSTDERTCVVRFSTAVTQQTRRGNEVRIEMERVDHAHFLEWPRSYPINTRELAMPARTRYFWQSVPRNLQPFFSVLKGTLIRKESRAAGSTSVVQTLRNPDPALLFAGYVMDAWDEGELLSEARTSHRSATMRAVFLILKIACIAAFLVSAYYLFR